jgi:hypothetical protein
MRRRELIMALFLVLIEGSYGIYPTLAEPSQSLAPALPVATPSPTSSSDPVRISPSPGNWVNVTSNLAGMASECGNMAHVSSKPGEDLMIAGVARQGLWGSSDGGTSWHRLGGEIRSATIVNRPSSILYDPVHSNVFWESGIYNNNGVYRSDNDGTTFIALGTISHIDSVSVDFSDPDRQTLLAGGHERSRTVYRSQNGGKTWVNVGANLPAGTAFSSYPLAIDSKTLLAGLNPSWAGGTGGIFQSDDSGSTWYQASSRGGGAQPLVASDSSIYWPDGSGSMVRGTGQGANWTWTEVAGDGTLMNVHPIELPDGRIASLDREHVVISSDYGQSWRPVGPPLPFTPVGLVYSDFDKAFYVWQFDCGNKVLPNAIMKLWQ